MRTRMLILILLVVMFQLLTSAAVLVFGGEFRDLKEYSYNTLVEKTKNRSTYVQNELQEKSAIVQEYAEQIDGVVSGILKERGASIADLKTDKELDYHIIESSADIVSNLLRQGMVSDAYLILDTGDLYNDEGSDAAGAALYLWNGDSNSDGGQFFTPGQEDGSSFDFYYRTLKGARENSDLKQNELGYWSGFSRVSSAVAPSMKYSLPLIAEDGTVYGILGIGLTENAVWSSIPSLDLAGENDCYVLGYINSGRNCDILTHSGLAYGTLLGGVDTLHISSREGENICYFDMVTEVELLGCVQYLEMYNGNSPYAGEQLALILVADRADALRPFLSLRQMLTTSVLLSLLVAVIVAVPGSSMIIRPLSNLNRQMKIKPKHNEVIRFQPSNIYEIDEITDTITRLQINVRGFSSQVSKMIRIADVGLGTFLYDRTDDSVFVGQSLIKVLRLHLPQDEDIVMDRQEFLNSIKDHEIRSLIAEGLLMEEGEVREDSSEVYQIDQSNGNMFWMRLVYNYSPSAAIGIVQDITDTMLERSRIEHERDHDTLTDLLTRQAYYRHVGELFQDKSKLNITAFIMIDLDNLKYVNDTYGHDFGDDYIRTAAKVLKKFQDHGGMVSRLSGDEFSICLSGFSTKEKVREVIANVRAELLRSRFLLADGTHFKISASMGVSWYPDDAQSRELLMKYADFAMYTIKHSTKGGIAEFDKNSYLADSVLLTGVEELNRVIEECSVRYAFQSIVSVKTGEIYGYEALMRVQSQIFLSPLELLRTAKTGAKLYEIERLTWTKALSDFQALIDAGRIENTAHVFINSIANSRLEPEVLAGIEQKYSHLLGQVVLEILESESADESCTAHKVQAIQRWGGQFALDDFGTGYNSEYALLSLVPNIIKIDRSIINGCDQDADRRMIIRNLVELARAKKILVLAEGVETEDEMKTAIACGADLLQGDYLAYPLFAPEPIAPEITDKIRREAERYSASVTGKKDLQAAGRRV